MVQSDWEMKVAARRSGRRRGPLLRARGPGRAPRENGDQQGEAAHPGAPPLYTGGGGQTGQTGVRPPVEA